LMSPALGRQWTSVHCFRAMQANTVGRAGHPAGCIGLCGLVLCGPAWVSAGMRLLGAKCSHLCWLGPAAKSPSAERQVHCPMQEGCHTHRILQQANTTGPTGTARWPAGWPFSKLSCGPLQHSHHREGCPFVTFLCPQPRQVPCLIIWISHTCHLHSGGRFIPPVPSCGSTELLPLVGCLQLCHL
jgi:hypothetical protein